MKSTLKLSLLAAALLTSACATTPKADNDRVAAEKSRPYLDGISFVTANHADGTCALPTAAQKVAKSATDAPSKEWKDLLSKASACVGKKDWKTLEQVAETLARVDINAPWGVYFLSVSAEARGDWQRAMWMADLALKKSGGQNALFTYQRGRVFLAMKETSKAMSEVNKAVGLEPRLIAGQLFLAEIYHRDLEWDKAGVHYEAMLEVDAKSAVALAGLGEVRFQQGNAVEAAKYYAQAVDVKSNRSDWWLRLAGIYETSLKNPQAALEAYKSVKGRPGVDVQAKIKSLEESVAAAARTPAQASVKEIDQTRSKK